MTKFRNIRNLRNCREAKKIDRKNNRKLKSKV